LTDAPLISVLMSVHNGETYLVQALDSILSQSFSSFEFIVIDDASTDDTAGILADYARRESRICLLSNQKNMGLAWSLNRGLKQVKGRYIARMDADDISLQLRLEKQFSFMEEHPGVGVIGTAVDIIDSAGQVIGGRMYPSDPIVIRWRLAFENPLCHPTVMIRRSLLQDAPYNSDLNTAQDYDLWCRLGLLTSFANLPEPLLRFRKHGANLTYTKGSEQRENSLHISQNYIQHFLSTLISDEVVNCLWERGPLSSKQALETAKLMEDLAKAILAETDLSEAERKVLRRHVARWIFERARTESSEGLEWRIVWKSARMDPSELIQRLKKRFVHGMEVPK
jgi:glycosyltransferase involved in cell wall biosynthesis